MIAYPLVEALSVTFFGLLGTWAALDRHHWFYRLAVAGLILGSALVIPAYEVVVMFGIQILTIVGVVWFARLRKNRRLRFSLGTALLLMVVASVVTGFAIRLPEFRWFDWLKIIAVGLFSAYATLLAMWIICGKPRMRVRACVGGCGLAVLVLLHFAVQCFNYALNNGRIGVRWELFLNEFFSVGILLHPWLYWSLLPIALGMPVMLTMIAIGRSSQWFNDSEDKLVAARQTNLLLVRSLFCLLAMLISLPMAFLLWELATPRPLPIVTSPIPNGYDDLIAGGESARALNINMSSSWALSDGELRARVHTLQPAFDRIDLGLTRASLPNLQALAEPGKTRSRHAEALAAVNDALWLRYAYANRVGTAPQKLAELRRILRFTQQAFRGTGLNWTYPCQSHQTADFALGEYKNLLKQVDRSNCREVARYLFELDEGRELWSERVRVQNLLDERDKWSTRLQVVLSRWSSTDPNDWKTEDEMRHLALHRSIVVAYAIKSYGLDHNRMPPDLNSLVPNFLPRIPDDPYRDGKLKMKLVPGGVAIYSAGLDGDDDGGTPHPKVGPMAYDPRQGDDVWVVSYPDLDATPRDM